MRLSAVDKECVRKVKITEPEVLRASLSLDLMGEEKRVPLPFGQLWRKGELDLVLWDRAGD